MRHTVMAFIASLLTLIASLLILIASLLILAPLQAAAGPALLFDADSGKVLYAEDADHQWHPASLTKIMTAYLTFEALDEGTITLGTKIACSKRANAEPASKVGLPVGAKMSVRLALNVLIVKSANDVAVMLAEAVGGDYGTFIAKMNATAARLGMTRTHFVNPNGLPARQQVTTARDLAKLSRAILSDFPEYKNIWAKRSVKIGRRRLGSHNALLKTLDGADGLKTGFICDSGYNIVASATRDGRRLMAVVLGGTSGRARNKRATSLLEHGFATLGWKQIFNTTTIDNMAMDVKARRAASIRRSVRNAACGYYRKRRRRKTTSKAVARARARAAKIRRAKRRQSKSVKSRKKGASLTIGAAPAKLAAFATRAATGATIR